MRPRLSRAQTEWFISRNAQSIATSPSTTRLGHRFDQLQRVGGALSFPLLEIAVDLAHRIRDVSEADNRLLLRAAEGVERGGLHLDGHDPLPACRRDR